MVVSSLHTTRPWALSMLAWVVIALPAMAEEVRSPFDADQRSHWSYQPVKRPAVPSKKSDWVRNPIDTFVLAKLQQHDLSPSPQADRRTLIRRATFDLLGLPPAPAEVEAFLADKQPGAFARLIDRLLASPRYGERWARHWLDLVRYAESDGYKSDKLRDGAWRYRDYVIRALNSDKPYDRFVAEQLAGDEIAPQDGEAQIATGFLRHWPYEDNGRDLDEQWTNILTDVTDVTGQVFLGMTIGCARCHDHKFDAILQKDYYRLQAFFAPMVSRNLPIGSSEQLSEYYAKLAKWESATASLRRRKSELAAPFLQQQQRSMGNQFPPHLQQILDKTDASRTPYERQLVLLAGKMLAVEPKKMAGRMKGDVRKQWNEINKELAKFNSIRPKKPSSARGVRDIGRKAPVVTIPDEPSTPIAPGFPTVLDPASAKIDPVADNPHTTGRRAALARWIASPSNPLTARVMVNRLWMHHFGRGLVASTGDFGVLGDLPSHAKLLDYLASELIREGWSLKKMHRLMMTSAVYQQAAVPTSDAPGRSKDPDNRLLWRMMPRRIEAEVMRDAMLAASGELSLKMHGPSVLPQLPAGLSGRYGWKATRGAAEQNRRSIYLVVKRNTHLPLLKSFDVPDTNQACSRRDKTTTPSQALVLLNDRWPLRRAQAMAGRVLREVGTEPSKAIAQAFEIAYCRRPTADELAECESFLQSQARQAAERIEKKQKVALPIKPPASLAKETGVAWVDLCHALLNSNEFLYVD
jgi:hypothetical protein